MEHVIVVGAGLVGTFLSAALAQLGYRVEVFDANPDPRDGEAGGGRSINLTLCHRGFAALDRLGVGDSIRAVSVPVYGRQMHGRDGLGPFQPYGNNGEALHSIIRGDLHRELLSFAEASYDIRFRFRHKCLDAELDGPAVMVKDLDTGTVSSVEGDRLLGTDGAYSAVRLRMMKLRCFNYSQEYIPQAYRELTVAADAVDDLDPHALHMWPRDRYMLIGFPNVDGSLTLSLHMPLEGDPSFAALRTEADVIRLFEESFPDTVPRITDLTESFSKRPVNPMVTIRCTPWIHEDRVALLGDAAHAIVPYYGQGVNSGFEDVAVLMQLLEQSGGDWSVTLPEFEQQRKPNADIIADLSIQNFKEISSRVNDPKFLLRKALERKLNELYPDQYMPLYSMISFTSLSYVEALDIEARQRVLVDRIMAAANLQPDELDSDAALHVIDRVVRTSGADSSPIELEASIG